MDAKVDFDSYDKEADRQSGGAISLELGAECYNRGMETHDAAEFQKAGEWYAKSETLGNVQASVNLGYIWYYGRTGRKDYAKAREQFEAAASKGNAEACYKLGDMISNGMGCAKDEHRAYEIYLMARALGEFDDSCVAASTAYRLAECFDFGRGCDADTDRALQYYLEAEHNFLYAIDTGYSYYTGNLRKCRESLKRLARECLGDWLFYYLELGYHASMNPQMSGTIVVKRGKGAGASVSFARPGEEPKIVKQLDAAEYIDFACEVFALGVYQWAPRFTTQYVVEDGATWDLALSSSGKPINCSGSVFEYPPEIPELFHPLENYGVPQMWFDMILDEE